MVGKLVKNGKHVKKGNHVKEGKHVKKERKRAKGRHVKEVVVSWWGSWLRRGIMF